MTHSILIRTAFAMIVVLAVFSACDKQSQTQDPIMYEDSELAKLMRTMHDEQLKIKESIANGETPDSYPASYTEMTTAEASEKMDIGDAYKAYASSHMQAMQQLSDSDSSNLVDNHNLVIKSCVACHQDHCTGPIEKIEKLYIR